MSAKIDFISRFAEMTASDEAVVRHRVRTAVDAGHGPQRQEPLHDTVAALWIIALLASPSHIDAVEIAERYGRFGCVAVRVFPEDKPAREAFDLVFPGLMTKNLLAILATTIRGVAEQRYHVDYVQADFPPFDTVKIRVLLRGEAQAAELTFSGEYPRKRKRRARGVWPIRQSQEMSGHVLDALAQLATPDFNEGSEP